MAFEIQLKAIPIRKCYNMIFGSMLQANFRVRKSARVIFQWNRDVEVGWARKRIFIINANKTDLTTSASAHSICIALHALCANAHCVIMFWASSNRAEDLFLLPQVVAVYFYFRFFFILSHPILKFIHTFCLVE